MLCTGKINEENTYLDRLGWEENKQKSDVLDGNTHVLYSELKENTKTMYPIRTTIKKTMQEVLLIHTNEEILAIV